jgi:hypothetical protein
MICNKNNRKIDGIQWIDLCIRIIKGLIERNTLCLPPTIFEESCKLFLRAIEGGLAMFEARYDTNRDNLLALEYLE